jgi:hypothetical protein
LVTWNPSSFAELFGIFQRFRGDFKRFLWTLFATLSWALWTTRNKFTIEVKFPSRPAKCIFKLLFFS